MNGIILKLMLLFLLILSLSFFTRATSFTSMMLHTPFSVSITDHEEAQIAFPKNLEIYLHSSEEKVVASEEATPNEPSDSEVKSSAEDESESEEPQVSTEAQIEITSHNLYFTNRLDTPVTMEFLFAEDVGIALTSEPLTIGSNASEELPFEVLDTVEEGIYSLSIMVSWTDGAAMIETEVSIQIDREVIEITEESTDDEILEEETDEDVDEEELDGEELGEEVEETKVEETEDIDATEEPEEIQNPVTAEDNKVDDASDPEIDEESENESP